MNYENTLLANKYAVLSKIASGSFGTICLGYNIQTHKLHAIKLQNSTAKNSLLLSQARILRTIRSKGFPKYYWSGSQGSTNALVMELLGQSLQCLFCTQNRKFSVKTTVMLGYQMVQRLSSLHSCSYVHRDIKPENFLMGIGKKKSVVYLVDFGLSNTYRDKKTKVHMRYRDKRKFVGTQRYVSINVMNGLEPSRRDDLQSVAYLLSYFLKGSLPWQKIQNRGDKTKKTQILNLKVSTQVGDLFDGFPAEFSSFLMTCRALKFDQDPDYQYLLKLLKQIGLKEEFMMDSVYDWLKCELETEKEVKVVKKEVVKVKVEEIKQEEDGGKTERYLPHFKDRNRALLVRRQNSQVLDNLSNSSNCLIM